jgi:hypothetical protein
MKDGLLVAAALAVVVGVAHSALGERYILIRLFRRENLPRLFGSDTFTQRTLRLAWHVTSVAWWGFAALLYALARSPGDNRSLVLQVIAVTFFATGATAAIGSHGKHLSWPVFLAIGALTWMAA